MVDAKIETSPATRIATISAWVLAFVPLLVLVVAIGVNFGSRYAPVDDIAGIEVHVRDVPAHLPLLGLYSRDRWSHPGPAMFYVLALPYRLSGDRSFSLHMAAVVINGLSLALMALIARRHGGTVAMLPTLVGGGVLIHSFGATTMSSPWNPELPVFPFGAVMFLSWAMLCGDAWALPVCAAVTTFCVQAHIGYTLLAAPIFLVGAVGLYLGTRRPVTDVGIQRPSTAVRRCFRRRWGRRVVRRRRHWWTQARSWRTVRARCTRSTPRARRSARRLAACRCVLRCGQRRPGRRQAVSDPPRPAGWFTTRPRVVPRWARSTRVRGPSCGRAWSARR